MVQFTALIKQFQEHGEKTGWTYFEIPANVAERLNPGTKKSFRVKGKLDKYEIKGVALLPSGKGSFIMALNGTIRKGIKKRKGASLLVQLDLDSAPFKFNKDFVSCLEDEPVALAFFKSQTPSMQKYFSKWIGTAKTELTKTKRIAQAVNALAKKQDFGQMLRSLKKERNEWKDNL
jgi:Domain of unknown function (DUF1905)/Bacteriocin-protection, YdeI or OmpD-Associated